MPVRPTPVASFFAKALGPARRAYGLAAWRAGPAALFPCDSPFDTWRALRLSGPLALIALPLLLCVSMALAQAPGPRATVGRSGGSFFANLYGDRKARGPGDIVHIIIAEKATASHSASRNLKRDSKTGVGPGEGWLDFLKALGYKGSHKSSDSAVSVRQGTLTTRVTVRVVQVLPNGNLLVEGRHSIVINKDTQTIVVRGEIRPRDLRADSTVYSYNVANLQVEYQGSDPGRPGKRTGIITRVLNFLF